MRNSLLALFLLFFVTHVPISCIDDDTCCRGGGSNTVTTTLIDSMSMGVGIIQAPAGSPEEFIHIDFEKRTFQNTFNVAEFAILYEVEEYLEEVHVSNHFSNPFMRSALAVPAPIHEFREDAISFISIYSNDTVYARDTLYVPGQNLNHLFSVAVFNNQYETPLMPYLKQQQTIEGAAGYLRLTEKLNRRLDQTFRLKFLTELGGEFELTTEPVKIKVH